MALSILKGVLTEIIKMNTKMKNSKFFKFLLRSSHHGCSIKKTVLKKSGNIHWKTPVLESLFNKAAGLQSCNFIKKRLQQMCFPKNICKIFKNVFFIEHLWWLLLEYCYWPTSIDPFTLSSPLGHHLSVLFMFNLHYLSTRSTFR